MFKITKFGQCCLLLEVGGKRILTDPGAYSTSQNEIRDIDIVLITHEHGDHLHADSLKMIVENNPQVTVVTNSSVGTILDELGIEYTVLEGKAIDTLCDITIEARDGMHVEIFEDFGQVQNTGYFIQNSLFYPGDAYTLLDKPVSILALPVAGPWCKVSDAIKYALKVAPKKAFPVHDVFLTENGLTRTHDMVKTHLENHNIAFVALKNNESISV